MFMTEANILLRMILLTIAGTRMIPNLGTADLVDESGFATNDIRRIQEMAMNRFGATKLQAMAASMAWVKAGRPTEI